MVLLILLVYHTFAKPFLIFIFGWVVFKTRCLNKLLTFYSFFYLFNSILALTPSLIEPNFDRIWNAFSFLAVYILFRFVAVLIGIKELKISAQPADVADKLHFFAPFYRPKLYRSVVIEKGKEVTFIKGYLITVLSFFIAEVIVSIVKIIVKSFIN